MMHNFYVQPGGEDAVFRAEAELLRSRDVAVSEYAVHNGALAEQNKMVASANAVFSWSSFGALSELLEQEKPDVVHVHNTFPILSPSIYYAAKRGRVPIVRTLHNYRPLCPAATLFRDGQVCESCLGRSVPWPAVRHKCYRGSRVTTAVASTAKALHELAGTYDKQVDHFIIMTDFGKQKYVEGGFPAERISVKPHFLAQDPGPGAGGNYALFVGRLAEEKGVETLLNAWRRRPGMPLKIVGDGPLRDLVKAAAEAIDEVEWLGHQPKADVLNLMGGAGVVIVPSIWYEPFGLVIIEAYAKGTPVLASNIGGLSELVDGAQLFKPGDPDDLDEKLGALLRGDQAGLRRQARARFESDFTAERNFGLLMDVYKRAGFYQPEPSPTLRYSPSPPA